MGQLHAVNGCAAGALALGALMPAAFGQQTLLSLDGPGRRAEFGTGIDVIPDVDGNGLADLVISSPRFRGVGGSRGRVDFVSGQTGQVIRSWAGVPRHNVFLLSNLDTFGEKVAHAGDVDADGVPDVVIGHPGYQVSFPLPVAGRAIVYSGATGAPLFAIEGETYNARMGASAAGVGDVDGDGRDDVLIGAPWDTTNGRFSGRAYLLSGATGQTIRTFAGSDGAQFGTEVMGAGDLDGDGVPDLLIGAPAESVAGEKRGAVYAYSGATGVQLYRLQGMPGNYGFYPSFFGYTMSTAGDLDTDGIEDFVVGAPWAQDPPNASGIRPGRVHVISGATGVTIRTHVGDEIYQCFGFGVAASSDVDGDGVNDVAITSLRINSGTGTLDVFSGATGALLWQRTGLSSDTGHGLSLRSGGDFDGDGKGDLAITSPWADTPLPRAGRVELVGE